MQTLDTPVSETHAPSTAPAARASFLDRTLVQALRLDWEKLAWIALVIIALLTRVIGLGDRPMSHDESLHVVYSFQLFDGRGYQHQPMMHGPLKFVLNPVMYFLFGVNDWSARILVALFGVAMVAFVWMLRPWLGRTGALLTALMYTISPALLYHSRYIRDEVLLTSLAVLLVVTMFRYLATRKTGWLIGVAVSLGLAFLTMEAAFIFGGIFGIFLVLALAAQLWAAAWPGGQTAAARRQAFRLLVGVSLPLLAAGLLLAIFKQLVAGIALLALGGGLALLAVGLAIGVWRWGLRRFAELDLAVLLLTLVMPFLSAVVLKALGWQISQFNNPGQVTLELVWQGGLILGLLFILSGVIGYFWLRQRWLIAAGIFWVIEVLFFTTFLTNGQGIGTGLIGSLGYWIDQQEVMRGGQPWYYFYMLVPLYEFLPMLLSLAGLVAWIAARLRRAPAAPAAAMSDAGATAEPPAVSVQALFEAFLVFWPAATWAVFTWVGEKMPWHTVYFAMSMAPLGGWWLGRIIDRIDWRGARRRNIFWLMALTPLFLIALKALLPPAEERPFAGVSVNQLSATAQWLLALVVTLALIYFLYDRVTALGVRESLRTVAVSLAALLLVLTLGVSYRFNYINYDYPIEPMVYAHATPDIRLAMAQIEEISRKTVGDHAIRVAYDDESTWPLEWYFRDYPNKVYFGASPSRDSMDSPIVIVGDPNTRKARPYLGDRYYEFNYRLIWWPRETYKDMTLERLWQGVRDPAQRKLFWDVVIHRRYTTPTATWDPIKRFTMFVRKDVAAQVWDWGAPTVAAEGLSGEPSISYESGQRTIAASQQIGLGVPGMAPGQFNFPRAVAVDGAGRVYVADSGNNRIQVFDANGAFLREWGSTCKLDTGEGCVNGGQGQFNEPWGIAVGQDGSVYVSDTWNHRVQKFTNSGEFVTTWGVFGSTGGELGQESIFYGPRAITIGRDGNVYVMDTGNKRVQMFNPDGVFITQWGGGGVVDGRFDEPVGLGQDANGNWYVADTWNRRIQKFSENFQYIAQWPINGWGSQSVVNKPALAVDSARGIVYAVDPENYRVLAFGLDGTFKATWGLYGTDSTSFALPTGIAVGPDGKVYVADGDAHRILVFPPVE
ncbi:MAG: Serine/threonine-protein kinase PknD [Chloroflexi bacterium ADurb.Bin325]|nr:MAG: Serine/threonine-protein kinase PknD [Chloroflexi bacterium ADurb.Bin325]